MHYQPLTIAYKRAVLAQMLQEDWTDKRLVKQNGSFVEISEPLKTAMILRIVAMDNKLAALEKKEQLAQQKAEQTTTPQQPEVKTATATAEAPAQAPKTIPGQPPRQKETVKDAFKRKALERLAAKKAASGT